MLSLNIELDSSNQQLLVAHDLLTAKKNEISGLRMELLEKEEMFNSKHVLDKSDLEQKEAQINYLIQRNLEMQAERDAALAELAKWKNLAIDYESKIGAISNTMKESSLSYGQQISSQADQISGLEDDLGKTEKEKKEREAIGAELQLQIDSMQKEKGVLALNMTMKD